MDARRCVNTPGATTALPVMTRSYALPPYEELAEWLLYCPETGRLTWRKDRWYNALAGTEAGSICPTTGYRRIRLGQKKKLQAHRVAWLLYYKVDPHPFEVDHIDTNRANNRIANLRLVTKQQNQFNRGENQNNTSGFKGVYRHGNKWRAGARVGGRLRWLGIFETPEQASIAWMQAVQCERGEHFRA